MRSNSAQPAGAGRLVVISGPSGSGKTTICKALTEADGVVMSVSATTRQKRAHEVHGQDYFFLSGEDFEQRIAGGAFLEHARYNGNRYGTLRSEVEREIARGQTVILEIEVQGTRALRESGVEATYVFVMPPSIDELQTRLEGRKTEDAETIRQRLTIACEEMSMAHLYDHVVINKKLELAVREVRGLLGLVEDRRGR